MAEKENQQYKWRQRKKRNHLLTAWIIGVVIVAAAVTFVINGPKNGNPLTVAKRYVEDTIGVKDYQVQTGARSLNNDNQFVQEYQFTYTADGKEVTKTINMLQQSEKRFGLFEQWDIDGAAEGKTADLEIIAPAGSQVLVNGVAPDSSQIKEDENLSPGAVCYAFAGVKAQDSKIQVNGLPFDSYEAALDTSAGVVDVRDQLVVGENAQTQMTELAKTMINELFTAAIQEKGASSLGSLFAQAANKDNLYKAIHDNMFQNGSLKVKSVTFSEFKPVFGEVYYPGKGEDSYIGMEMTLSYNCTYEPADDAEAESETESEAVTETETETETGSEQAEKDAAHSAVKEAKFYFKYVDGNCTVTTIEVPNAI